MAHDANGGRGGGPPRRKCHSRDGFAGAPPSFGSAYSAARPPTSGGGPRPDVPRWRRPSRLMAFTAVSAVLAAGVCLGEVTPGGPPPKRSADKTGGGTVSLAASADTYVIRQRPAEARGKAVTMTSATWPDWSSESYLAFDVPDRQAGIRGARVDLTLDEGTRRPRVLELRSLPTTGWTENTTWRDRPTPGPVLATAAVDDHTRTVSFDVSRWVERPGRYAFAVTNPGRSSAARFHTRESGGRGPRLVVSDRPDPTRRTTAPAPSVTTPTAAPEPTPSPTRRRRTPRRDGGTAPVARAAGRGAPLCGASLETGLPHAEALRQADRRFGGLEMVRIFYPGAPAPWPGKMGDDRRTAVISFKFDPREVLSGRHDAAMRSWFRDAPRDRDIYWVYFHEPEDDIARGAFSAADYRAAWRRLRRLADAAGNDRLKATLVLMGWSLDPKYGRNWYDYYPGRDVVQVLGWDVYNLADRQGRYQDPAEMYGRVVATSRAERLPFGVAETGSYLVAGDDGTRRAAWIRAMARYLTRAGALWVAYFDLDWPSGDFRLRDPHSVRAWRDFC